MTLNLVSNRVQRGLAGSFALVGMLSVLVAVSGCGGTNSEKSMTSTPAPSRATGTATLSIIWPERNAGTRLIPRASNSIRIVITNPGDNTVLATRIVARPAGNAQQISTESITGLPVGTLFAAATAFPTADATGVAQATASSPVNIRFGANNPLSLTMGTTIASVSIVPQLLEVETSVTLPTSITARDANGNVVLTGSELSWSVGNPAIASVDQSGNVTGLALGSTTLTVVETESGRTTTIPVTVVKSSVNIVGLNANDIAFDAVAQKIYASVPSREGGINGNSVVTIDPTTFGIGQPIFVGSEPADIAISDDAAASGTTAKYLFTILRGEPAVVRVNLETGKVDQKFLVADETGVAYPSDSLAISPGSGQYVAVSRQKTGVSPRFAGVVVYRFDEASDSFKFVTPVGYDPLTNPNPTLSQPISNIVRFDIRNNEFSGFNVETTAFNFTNFVINPDNSLTTQRYGFTVHSAFNVDFRISGGRGFTGQGGVFQTQPTEGYPGIGAIASLAIGDATAPFAADSRLARVWYLTGGDTGTLSVKAFDTNSFLPVGILTIPNVRGLPIRLIRIGQTGLAFNTSGGQIYIIRRAPGLPNPGSDGGGL